MYVVSTGGVGDGGGGGGDGDREPYSARPTDGDNETGDGGRRRTRRTDVETPCPSSTRSVTHEFFFGVTICLSRIGWRVRHAADIPNAQLNGSKGATEIIIPYVSDKLYTIVLVAADYKLSSYTRCVASLYIYTYMYKYIYLCMPIIIFFNTHMSNRKTRKSISLMSL